MTSSRNSRSPVGTSVAEAIAHRRLVEAIASSTIVPCRKSSSVLARRTPVRWSRMLVGEPELTK